MAYQIEWRDGGVFVTLTGDIDIEELNEANGRIHGDERLDSMDYQIWLMSGADLSGISLREIEQPTATDNIAASFKAQVRVALVSHSPHTRELAEHYRRESAAMGSPWEIRTFEELEEAEAWVHG